MRRIVVIGLALICVVALGSLAATREPRSAIIDTVTRTPTPVQVTNFPALQGVTGAVNVGNLPAVQNVVGTVAVGNLPLDANGNVRVSAPVNVAPPTVRFVGITQAVLPRGTPILALSHTCDAELSATRVCTFSELARQIPPPAWSGTVMIVGDSDLDLGGLRVTLCLAADGGFDECTTIAPAIPVACCGF